MSEHRESTKLGTLSGVYIPVFLNIMSILMFLRFGLILGQVGFMGIFGEKRIPSIWGRCSRANSDKQACSSLHIALTY